MVLVATPRDSAENVSPDAAISVQFAPIIDEKTILKEKGIRVIRLADNRDVKGQWKASRGGSKFTLTPDRPLKEGQYKIVVSSGIRNKEGTSLVAEKIVQFRVGRENDASVFIKSLYAGP